MYNKIVEFRTVDTQHCLSTYVSIFFLNMRMEQNYILKKDYTLLNNYGLFKRHDNSFDK